MWKYYLMLIIGVVAILVSTAVAAEISQSILSESDANALMYVGIGPAAIALLFLYYAALQDWRYELSLQTYVE